MESVRTENMKLYEKIKFLQTYFPGPSSTSSSPPPFNRNSMKSFSNGGGGVSINFHQSDHPNTESDQIVNKYSQIYENRLNPFDQFSRAERSRAYRNLKPYEKIMLNLVIGI